MAAVFFGGPGEFMTKAVELLRQGRTEELWQMCCGYLKLNIDEFMTIQERLLLKQIELLKKSGLGRKMLRGARPETVEEFRESVPLTTYQDYCPELLEKREDFLPAPVAYWAHTSGKSGEYPLKWVPISRDYAQELSVILYGIGMLSCARGWGDTSSIPSNIKLLYSVAPKPYISGTFADVLLRQTPLDYIPPLQEAERLSFEERIRLGFQQAMYRGLDYFFGLSLVLVSVGDKFIESSQKIDLRPFLAHPSALARLGRGWLRSRLAGRRLLPKDLWSVRGIIGSGLDSGVYKEKIKEFWGRYPLDLYSATEGGVIATQAWDYAGMTFIPNLNFLEFIPEDEYFKWQMDRSYRPRTRLMNEVKAGENYELVLTNFHGGAMVRYRIGDMVRITALRDEKLGIELPQMAFERRADNLIDFGVIRLTEKVIWQALENSGIPYVDWIAQKEMKDKMFLHVYLELKDSYRAGAEDIAREIYRRILETDDDRHAAEIRDDFEEFIDFDMMVSILPHGTFDRYKERKQAEGADLAHLKPPHVNPSNEVLSMLVGEPEETIVVTKVKKVSQSLTETTDENDRIAVR